MRRTPWKRCCFVASLSLVSTLLPVAANPPTDNLTDALSALDQRRDYFEFSRTGKLDSAIDAAEEYLKLNRWDGEVWFGLGNAHLRLGQCEPAIAAFGRAHELGYEPRAALYNTACALAVAGRSDAALDALQAAMDAGFVATPEHITTDENLDSIRSHPRFAWITGLDPPKDLGRNEKWQYDIDFFRRRLESVHAHPFRIMKREEFESAVNKLSHDVPRLSDIEIQIRLQVILAAVGDGHTKMQLPENAFRTLPIRFEDYADGLFVRAATTEHRDLVGCRVLEIGKRSAEKALESVRPMVSLDNEQGFRYQAPWILSYLEVLRYFGVVGKSSKVSIRLAKPSGEAFSVKLPTIKMGHLLHWVSARQLGNEPPPLYLRHREKKLHFEYLPADRIAYLRIWAIGNGPEETMAQFAERAFNFIDVNDVAATVIDIRQNTGGNNFLNRSLVDRVLLCEKALAPGRLFVVADRVTFSAAMDLLTALKSRTNALLVGEPARGRPNGFGENTRIALPYSKAAFSCSSLYHQYSYSQDTRTVIAADLPAELTSDDFATIAIHRSI